MSRGSSAGGGTKARRNVRPAAAWARMLRFEQKQHGGELS
jgi:hypothetical protein